MKKILLTALVAVLAGCGGGMRAGMPVSHGPMGAAGHRAGDRSLLVMPEAGVTPILQAIQGAKRSIHMEMYLLLPKNDSGQILAALMAASKAGVDVEIILDGSPFTAPKPPECKPVTDAKPLNQEAFDTLTAAGVKVKWSSKAFRYTHQKSMVIDGTTAFIMTMNMTTSAFRVNREYVVIDRDKSDVADVERIFQADWAARTYAPVDPDLVVSPTNSRARILGLIDSAKRSLILEVEFLKDREIAQALGRRIKAGVDVTVMLSHQEVSVCSGVDSDADQTKELTAVGVTKLAFIQAVKLHAKAIVVDGTRAYVGSENFTSNSLDNNRELGILLEEPGVLNPLLATLNHDWEHRADPAPPHAMLDLAELVAVD